MLRKDIVGGLFLCGTDLMTVFQSSTDHNYYYFLNLRRQKVSFKCDGVEDLKRIIKEDGFILIGRFEELDIESLIEEKTADA